MACINTAGMAQELKIRECDIVRRHEPLLSSSSLTSTYTNGDKVLTVYPDYAIARNLNLKS
jgi:hypothetical protein